MSAPWAIAVSARLEENQSTYTREPVYTLRQVYFSTDERGAMAAQDAGQALLLLETDSSLTNPEELGDPLSLSHRYIAKDEGFIAATFGKDFANGLRDLEPGKWQGPIRSGYGLHLVLIEEFSAGRALTLEEAERDVRRDWANEQRVKGIDRLYDELRGRYTITVEPMTGENTGS